MPARAPQASAASALGLFERRRDRRRRRSRESAPGRPSPAPRSPIASIRPASGARTALVARDVQAGGYAVGVVAAARPGRARPGARRLRAAAGGRRHAPLAPAGAAGPAARSTPVSRVRRCASVTGITLNEDHEQHHDVDLRQLLAEADVAEDPDRQRVLRAGGEVVTTISSNDSANASRPPATSAVAIIGSVTKPERLPAVGAEVHRGLDQRRLRAAQAREHVVVDDDDAEGRVPDRRSSAARSRRPLKVKNEFSAIPVMIPGSAIGSTSRNETASRPKKRKRCDRERRHRAEHDRDRRWRSARRAPTASSAWRISRCARSRRTTWSRARAAASSARSRG